MPEDYICPVCLAFKDPATGVCLACGKKYHLLDIPISLEDGAETKITDFIIPFQNGFMTFKARPTMEISCDSLEIDKDLTIYPSFRKKATLTFEFLPKLDTDDNNVLYTIYCS